MTKAVVVYFSHTGHTRKLAEKIAERTGADLAEIRTDHTYPADYHQAVDQVMEELRQKFQPEIQVDVPDWERYDTVFLGSPNW